MTTLAQPTYRKRVGYQATLLGGIALLASAVLVIADLQTRDTIAERRAEDFRRTLEQVLPAQMHDNRPQEDIHTLRTDDGRSLEVYRARQEGRVSGVAFRVQGRGYAGPIHILMGVDAAGEVLGVRVLQHKETPGLGDKIEVNRDPWILSFDGLSFSALPAPRWAVQKDGGPFDQFTGATITPRAVVNAVRDGLTLFHAHQSELLQRAPDAPDEPMPTAIQDSASPEPPRTSPPARNLPEIHS